MLNVRRSGSLLDAASFIRDVPRRVMPFAASTALTRVAKYAATTALPAEMRTAFQAPTSYTLNSLRVEPSTVETLSARVMVKTQAAGNAPQSYLLPEVDGGQRRAKGMEAALRYEGILRAGQYLVPGAGMSLDAHGNVSGAQVRTILSALKAMRGGVSAQGQREGKGRRLKNDLFVGTPNGGNRPDGIWRREGKRLRMLFVFTDQAPSYRKRLDFTGTVQQVALSRFSVEFERAASAMLHRGARA